MSSRTTVYLINLSLGVAGIERRFANVWRELKQRGNVDPILVVPDTQADLLERAGLLMRKEASVWRVRESPPVRRLARWLTASIGAAPTALFRSRLLARSYRAVWAGVLRDPEAVIHIGMNCSGLVPPDVPIVYECVDSTLSQLATRHFVRAAGRRCVVHCQTERIRTTLEQYHAQRSPVWTTVTSPCYFASYSDEPRLGPVGLPTIAFSGRFAPEKNPMMLLEAAVLLRRTGHNFRILMLGEGPLLPLLSERIRVLDLADVIEIGFDSRAVDRLPQASIFVSLQTGDNYGSQSLLEAMGAGCVVVATDVGETARIIKPDTGLLIKPSAPALAAALSSLINDPARLSAMGSAASRLARSEFTAERYAQFLESLYRRATALHRKGGAYE